MPRAARGPVAVLLLVLGALTGLASVAVHGRWWGLLLALAATGAALVALRGGWWLRLPFALGWVSALAVLTPARPEGDYLVAGDTAGYLLLGAGVVVLCAGLVGLRPAAPADGPTSVADSGPGSASA